MRLTSVEKASNRWRGGLIVVIATALIIAGVIAFAALTQTVVAGGRVNKGVGAAFLLAPVAGLIFLYKGAWMAITGVDVKLNDIGSDEAESHKPMFLAGFFGLVLVICGVAVLYVTDILTMFAARFLH